MLNGLSKYSPQLLAVLRIVTALLFIEHGTQKLFNFPPMSMPMPDGMGTLMLIAGILEFVGGLLILVGFLTRPVAFILSGMMAVAYFVGASAAGLFSGEQYGRRGDPVLLHVPVSRRRRTRRLERRQPRRLIVSCRAAASSKRLTASPPIRSASAIKARRVLSFAYKASDRTAEPYILGYDDKGKLVLSAVQLSGGSGSGFRSFDLAGLSAVAATGRHFRGTHPDYNPE